MQVQVKQPGLRAERSNLELTVKHEIATSSFGLLAMTLLLQQHQISPMNDLIPRIIPKQRLDIIRVSSTQAG